MEMIRKITNGELGEFVTMSQGYYRIKECNYSNDVLLDFDQWEGQIEELNALIVLCNEDTPCKGIGEFGDCITMRLGDFMSDGSVIERVNGLRLVDHGLWECKIEEIKHMREELLG